jgi:hypothetical protein
MVSRFGVLGRETPLRDGARQLYLSTLPQSTRAIEVHHKTYVRVFNELVSDLLPVCSACHREIHHLKPANDNQLSLPFPITDDGCARGSTPQQRAANKGQGDGSEEREEPNDCMSNLR